MDYHTRDGLITIVIVELGREPQSKQYYGKDSETYPDGNCKPPNIRRWASVVVILQAIAKHLGSATDLRQVSAFFLETCVSSSCTVCLARPIHYTKDAPCRGPGCLHLPDWET